MLECTTCDLSHSHEREKSVELQRCSSSNWRFSVGWIRKLDLVITLCNLSYSEWSSSVKRISLRLFTCSFLGCFGCNGELFRSRANVQRVLIPTLKKNDTKFKFQTLIRFWIESCVLHTEGVAGRKVHPFFMKLSDENNTAEISEDFTVSHWF